jgi:hypothetical protein
MSIQFTVMTGSLPDTVVGRYNGLPLGKPRTYKFAVDGIALANNLFQKEADWKCDAGDATCEIKCNTPEDPSADLQSDPWKFNEVFFGGVMDCTDKNKPRSEGGSCYSDDRGKDHGWKQNLYTRNVKCEADKPCTTKQQLRVLNTYRLRTLNEDLTVKCEWQTDRNLYAPNGDGTPTKSDGTNVAVALKDNRAKLEAPGASITLGNCQDPIKDDRIGEDTGNNHYKNSTVTCGDVKTVKSLWGAANTDVTDVNPLTEPFNVTFLKGSMAPHIVEYDVTVDGVPGDDQVTAYLECVVQDHEADWHRFGGSDDPEFWKVSGIYKLQYQYTFDFDARYTRETCPVPAPAVAPEASSDSGSGSETIAQ